MNLGIGDFRYSDLYDFGRLNELAAAFDQFTHENDAQLFVRFEAYRLAMQDGTAHGGLKEPEESELLIAVSRQLGTFLSQLFRTDPTPINSLTSAAMFSAGAILSSRRLPAPQRTDRYSAFESFGTGPIRRSLSRSICSRPASIFPIWSSSSSCGQ